MKALLWMLVMLVGFNLELNSKGQETKHVVKKGETLYSIAKHYGVTVSQIAKANSISVRTQVKAGQHLMIPGQKVMKDVVRNYKPIAVPSTPDTPYREEDVRPRPTLIQAETPRPSPEKPKEKPLVPKATVANTGLKTASTNPAEYAGIFDSYADQGYKISRNRGIANYIMENTTGNPNLAFYNDAEVGSLIRVINLLNHKTIYAKVVGKVPPADASNEIILKLSNKAAQDLEVKEDKFLVEVDAFSAN